MYLNIKQFISAALYEGYAVAPRWWVLQQYHQARYSKTITNDLATPPLWQAGAVGGDTVAANDSSEESDAADDSSPTIDLDRIWRTLERSLLMLYLGATPEEIKTLPKKGLDGKPYLNKGTVEVTVLWTADAGKADDVRKALEKAGLAIEGSASAGSIVVGRIAVSRLLDLAQVDAVRRIVPTRGS